MKRKRPTNRKSHFNARRDAIDAADALMAKARALLDAPANEPKAALGSLMQAALFFEAAARAFTRGFLGLMARHAWASAVACYARANHESGAARCSRQRERVPTYWGEDETTLADRQ